MIKPDAFGDSLCRWDGMTRSNPTVAAQGTGHLYHEALPLVCSRLGNNNQKNLSHWDITDVRNSGNLQIMF